jgi:hypothetical protein
LSCSKKTKVPQYIPPTPDSTPIATQSKDYLFIPTTDAKWVFMYNGTYVGYAGGYYFDTSVHFLTTISCAGYDTIYQGKNCVVYNGTSQQYKNHLGNVTSTMQGKMYVWQDTNANKVYIGQRWSNQVNGLGMYIDYTLQAGDTIFDSYNNAVAIVDPIDSFLIDGNYCKKWTCTGITTGIKQFYQAYGVGKQRGITKGGPFYGNGSKLLWLDFIYKSDSIRINY